ncbi:pilus assembly protein [Massilia glaciei]|uniref:Pilus assembly protein n=2 Tax=Massilia glaciei TaxID=1524097 RepID=A0A2U2HKD4_9BURK|nr:pilus assembly protein [Massilia glaciei]
MRAGSGVWRQRSRPRRQGGAALIIALCMMVAVLAIGVSAAQSALNAEKSARNERDRQIALQAAEAALADAERDIEGGSDPASARAALFAPGSALGFVEGCGGRGDQAGLCVNSGSGAAPAWQTARLDSAAANTVAFGAFTGASMPAGRGALPAQPPRYIIELMHVPGAGLDAGEREGNVYRITAIGFGMRAHTQVVLQSLYRKLPVALAP